MEWNGIRPTHTLYEWAGLGLVLCLLLGVHQSLQAQEATGLEPVFTRLSTELVRYFPPVSGDIIRVQKGQLYVSLDRQNEVWPGLQLSVYREGDPLKHPTSGAVLGRVEEPLGEVTIVHVAEHYTVAKPVDTQQAESIQSGDKVRLTAGRIPLALLPLAGSPPAGLTADAFHHQLRQALERTERFHPLAADRARIWLLQRG
ncbi:MAG: hypothetical protein OEU26_29165, partial [Candidatus Tectomicrobia bacterium]|nr:hypothetical protein [Candidatus Tectomicrobia bacterium]